MITRRGQEVAAVVSMADYLRLRRLDRGTHRAWVARVEALPPITGTVDSLDLLKAARDERDDRPAR